MEFSKILGITQDAINAFSVGSSLGTIVNPDIDHKSDAIHDFSRSLNDLYHDRLDREALSKKTKKLKDSASDDTKPASQDTTQATQALTGNKLPSIESPKSQKDNTSILSKYLGKMGITI